MGTISFSMRPIRSTTFGATVMGFGLAFLAICLSPTVMEGSDWPRFRGPNGSGSSDAKSLPERWSETEGVLWKANLPGPGSSSPIVSKGRIFVTAYSGYGTERGGGGRQEDLKRHVVAIDAASGKIVWDKSIESKLPEEPYQGIGVPNHGYASATPAADGERVVAYFGRSGVVAYDFEGKELWRAAVAPDPRTHGFGTASSPVIWRDLVIVSAGIECEAIVAFDKKTGAEKWRSPAPGYGSFWGTPIIVDAGERQELVVSAPQELWGINPENGKLRWYTNGVPDQNLCTSPIQAGGMIYVVGGRGRGGALAVRPGGKGDVSETHVKWRASVASYVTSPVVHGEHMYGVDDRGIAYCLKLDTGEEVYRSRIDGANGVYASLLAADGKLYCVSRRNGTFVLPAEPRFEVIAKNVLASDNGDFNASPVAVDGRLYLRSDRALYAIGKASE